jgi:predicted Zn-dependent protease
MASNVAIASGRVNSASAMLTTFVAHHPNARLAQLELAAAQIQQNKPQLALDALKPIRVRDPAVEVLLALGYLQLGMLPDALASFENVSSLPKANAFLKQQLPLSQFQVRNGAQIINGFSALLKADPDNLTGAAPLIAALMAASKWDDALKVADGLARQAPESPIPAFYKGLVFTARGHLTDAEAALDAASAVAPNFAPALYYRANILVAFGKYDAAKKDLDILLGQGSTHALASIRLAEIAADNGQDQESVALLNQAASRYVTTSPRLALANFQIGRGKYQDAQATLNQLMDISKSNPEGQALQGLLQTLSGRGADASSTFRALIKDNNEHLGGYILLARALSASKDQAKAEEAAKKGIELAPESVQLQRSLLEIQIAAGKSEDAIGTARKFESENPGLDADILLADAFFCSHRTNEADVLVEKILNKSPPSRLVLQLSQVARNSGNSRVATALLSRWIANNPNDLVVQRELRR